MTTETRTFAVEVGDKLPNGAILLDVKASRLTEYIVLALHAGAGAAQPFCTWQANDRGLTYWGHYHDNLAEAFDDFKERP